MSKTRPLTKRKRAGRPPIPAPEIEALDSESDEPIERQIYLALRRSLMSGAILPGSRISSRSIASSLGVSAMPVREALKRLESDGAMKSSAKSCFVNRADYPLLVRFAIFTTHYQGHAPILTLRICLKQTCSLFLI